MDSLDKGKEEYSKAIEALMTAAVHGIQAGFKGIDEISPNNRLEVKDGISFQLVTEDSGVKATVEFNLGFEAREACDDVTKNFIIDAVIENIACNGKIARAIKG